MRFWIGLALVAAATAVICGALAPMQFRSPSGDLGYAPLAAKHGPSLLAQLKGGHDIASVSLDDGFSPDVNRYLVYDPRDRLTDEVLRRFRRGALEFCALQAMK
jgi:hypothetical protein